MDLIADMLLIAGALGAGFYCLVLSRRLRRFTDLEKGVGGAVAVLSTQVDDMTRALRTAQTSAAATSGTLDGLTARAEDAARRLELLVASMHDLPETAEQAKPVTRQPSSGSWPDRPSGASAPASHDDTPRVEAPPSTLFLSARARIREAVE